MAEHHGDSKRDPKAPPSRTGGARPGEDSEQDDRDGGDEELEVDLDLDFEEPLPGEPTERNPRPGDQLFDDPTAEYEY